MRYEGPLSSTEGRTNAGAYSFSNGKVVLFGGDNNDVSNYTIRGNSIEYDIATFTWSSTPLIMVSPRTGFAHVQLPNTRILVFGGYDGTNTINTSESYNHSTRAWAAIPSMNEARVWHSAVLLNNGKVLVAGGTATRTAELYDPVANSWSSAGTTTYNHERRPSLTLLPDGKALLLGDENIGSDGENKGELYNPATNSWTVITDTLNEPRHAQGAHLMQNGKVLITSGNYSNTAEMYDPATMTFDTTATMLEGKARPGMFSLRNGNVLVYGRRPTSAGPTSPPNENYNVFIFEHQTNTWYNYPNTAIGVDFTAQYITSNGFLGIIGGHRTGVQRASNIHLQFVDSTAVFIESADLPQLGLSPNPASDYVRVSLGDDFPLDGEMLLHDMLGRVVRRTRVVSSEVMVDLGGLGAGVYVAILYSGEGKMVGQGKVVRN